MLVPDALPEGVNPGGVRDLKYPIIRHCEERIL